MLTLKKKWSRRTFEGLRVRLACERVMSRQRPTMAGSYDDPIGNGAAYGQTGARGAWMWQRELRGGQWYGVWRRVRVEDL